MIKTTQRFKFKDLFNYIRCKAAFFIMPLNGRYTLTGFDRTLCKLVIIANLLFIIIHHNEFTISNEYSNIRCMILSILKIIFVT
jgi:hypothetical protein